MSFITDNTTLKKLTLSGSKDEAKLYNLQNFISLATALTPETWKSELDKVMLKIQSLVHAEIFKYIKEGKTLIEASKLVEAEPSTFENLMFKQYSTNTTLETLELKKYKIDEMNAKIFGNIFQINKSLTTLSLKNCSINQEGVVLLAETLKNWFLRTFNFEFSSIDDLLIIPLAEALKINKSLTTLSFKGNNIKDEGAIALAKALKSNHVLTSLYLDQNKINDKGLYALAEVLRINNKTLKELNIMYNAFGEGIEQLKNALKQNPTLQNLFESDFVLVNS